MTSLMVCCAPKQCSIARPGSETPQLRRCVPSGISTCWQFHQTWDVKEKIQETPPAGKICLCFGHMETTPCARFPPLRQKIMMMIIMRRRRMMMRMMTTVTWNPQTVASLTSPPPWWAVVGNSRDWIIKLQIIKVLVIKLQIISQDLSKDELSEQKTVVDDNRVVWGCLGNLLGVFRLSAH